MDRRRTAAGIGALVALAWLAWWLTPPPPVTAAPPAPVAAPPPADAPAAAVRPTAPSPPRKRGRGPLPPPDEQAPQRIARCAVPPEVAEQQPSARVTLERADPPPSADGSPTITFRPQGRRPRALVPVAWRGGALLVEVPDGAVPTGTLALDGYVETALTLTATPTGWACAVGPLVVAPTLSGRVVTAAGVPADDIWVYGCGGWTRTDADGGFFLQGEPGPCTLRASRRDGLFTLRSPPVDVDPRAADEIVLDLSLPAFRAAGVGTVIHNDDDGAIAIREVLPGGAADAAGLRAGDVILALDGEDVSGWSVDEFIDLAIGPAETEVVYRILRDGQELEVPMTRQEMDRER